MESNTVPMVFSQVSSFYTNENEAVIQSDQCVVCLGNDQ